MTVCVPNVHLHHESGVASETTLVHITSTIRRCIIPSNGYAQPREQLANRLPPYHTTPLRARQRTGSKKLLRGYPYHNLYWRSLSPACGSTNVLIEQMPDLGLSYLPLGIVCNRRASNRKWVVARSGMQSGLSEHLFGHRSGLRRPAPISSLAIVILA